MPCPWVVGLRETDIAGETGKLRMSAVSGQLAGLAGDVRHAEPPRNPVTSGTSVMSVMLLLFHPNDMTDTTSKTGKTGKRTDVTRNVGQLASLGSDVRYADPHNPTT